MSYLFLIDNPNTEIFLSDKNVVQIYSHSLRQRMNALKTSAFFFCSSGDFALLVVGIVKAE